MLFSASKPVWTSLDKHVSLSILEGLNSFIVLLKDNIQDSCLKFKTHNTIHNTYCQTTSWRHLVEMGSLSTALCLSGSRDPCAADGHRSASIGCPWRSRSSHCAARQILHPLLPQAVRNQWQAVGSPLQHYCPWTPNISHLKKWERLSVRWENCRLSLPRLENTDLLWNIFKCSKYTTRVLSSWKWIWGMTSKQSCIISLKDTVCFIVQLLLKMTFT